MFPRHPHNPGRSTGFTLLEIMVSMLLLTIILTASVSLLFLNVRGWDGLAADSERVLDEWLIKDRIGTVLATLEPLKLPTPEGRRLAFAGEPRHLHFVAPAPQQFNAGGFFEYLLAVEPDQKLGWSLVLYYLGFRPDTRELALPEGGHRRVLFEGLDDVEFAYFGSKRRGAPAEWTQRWENDLDGYPELVKIVRIKSGNRGGRDEQIVRLLISASAGAGGTP